MPRIIKSPVPPQRKPSVDLSVLKRQEAMSNAQKAGNDKSNNTLMTETESSSESTFSNSGRQQHQQQPQSRPTTVKFAKTVTTHDVLAVDGDYTQEEKDACWFTSDEKEKFTSKREKIIVRIEAGRPEKQGKPFRGLECWTESGSKALNEQISRTIDAVMDEQDKQWASGDDDCYMIAKLSREITAGSLQRALDMGGDDEETAFAIRGTMFDDVNALTDDDSVVGMASLIAQKRRKNRRTRSKGKDVESSMAGRKIRRSGRRPDPDGEDAAKSELVKEQREAAKEAMKQRALARAKANSKKKKKTRVRIVSDKLNDGSGSDADDDSIDASAHSKKSSASTAPTTRPKVTRQRTAKQAYDEPWR